MWDNVTRGAFPSVGRGLLAKIAWMLLIILVVCGILAVILFPEALNIDGLVRAFRYRNISEEAQAQMYSFDAHNSNSYGSLNGGLAVASVGGLSTYGEDGAELAVSQGQMSLPVLLAAEDMVMAYDVGGTMLLAVDDGGRETLRVTAETEILDADLSRKGSLCYLSSAPGYKSVLAVYNEKQELVYRWLSSSTYMSVCAVSEDGKSVATVGLNQAGGNFESTLNLFATDQEQILHTVSLGNQLIYDLTYLDNGTLCAVGETELQILDGQGALLASYAYDGKYLKDHHWGGDGFLTLTLNMYRAGNRYSVATLDENGEAIATVYVGEEILDLSACGKYIAVLTNRGLTIYDRELEIYAETQTVNSATAVLMREDGTALLLGAGEGSLFIP